MNDNKSGKADDYSRLCNLVETALHCKMKTPADFDLLHNKIFERTHVMVSSTTLKRIWGYISSVYKPSSNSLDALAQFLGYNDYDSFCQGSNKSESHAPSNIVLSHHIDVCEDLKIDDDITLYWAPDRICRIRYLGASRFRVISSENTRLKEGDTFSCSLIIKGEPLYLSQLIQGTLPPANYVCGKQGGIRYQFD